MSEHVILLHGLWMRGFTLRPLARRLRGAGYGTEIFDYASVAGGIGQAASRLRDRLHARRGVVHLVGHSLGALVALEAARGGEASDGHVVCLGAPLRGSAAARVVAALPGGRGLLGRSAGVLATGIGDWTGARRVGVVAGTLPFGLGALFGLAPPHDGTVSVEETRIAGIAGHCTVAASHTGLLFSREAAALALRFLRSGRFAPE
jgi:pimeloyl-ACP methyl ester carboxylesterase